jgi:IS4 transposase
VKQPGFRVQTFIVATTLLEADEFTKDDLATLYRAPWHAELDLRSLKRTMQMDVLRGKTPELVRKEIWTHVLAYTVTALAPFARKIRGKTHFGGSCPKGTPGHFYPSGS